MGNAHGAWRMRMMMMMLAGKVYSVFVEDIERERGEGDEREEEKSARQRGKE